MDPHHGEERLRPSMEHQDQRQNRLAGQLRARRGYQSSGASSGTLSPHGIPANAEPAFWDTLPELSRYPHPHQLNSQHRPGTPAKDAPLHHLAGQRRFPSSASTAFSKTCPQPSSGSIHDLRDHRRASSMEKEFQSNAASSSVGGVTYGVARARSPPQNPPLPRANSDLKDIYTTQQPHTLPFSRTQSRIVSAMRRQSPVSSSTPSSSATSDRALLPSQQLRSPTGPSFDESRKLSRTGALRRKKTGILHTPKDLEAISIETEPSPTMPFALPTPPVETIDRLGIASEPAYTTSDAPTPRTSQHQRNRTAVDTSTIEAQYGHSRNVPTSPTYTLHPLPTPSHGPLPTVTEASKRVVRFSAQATYAPSPHTGSDSEHSDSSTEVLDIGKLMGKGESKDEAVETAVEMALEEAAANARLHSPREVESVVKKEQRGDGGFMQAVGLNAGFRFPVADEGSVEPASVPVSELGDAVAGAEAEDKKVLTPGKKHGHRRSASSVSGIVRSILGQDKGVKKGDGSERKVSFGGKWVRKVKGVFRREY